ncbi:MAG: signal peptidase II [Halofilum sp. (in: g-proteobacteria)]|nr:signal peptidase II [Halofilum sp. (in: g-proteobacteria)]
MHRSMPWFAGAAAIAVADQLAKLAAVHALVLHDPVAVLPFLNLTLVHNTGAAFSFLAGAGGWQRGFFIVLTLVIGAVIAVWLARSAWRNRATATALTLILGGAVGNLVDRVRLGYVIDFVDLHAAGWHWPAFNVADAAISCGAVLLAVLALTGRE